MNQVSWLVYLSDVVGNAAVFFQVMSIVGGFFIGIPLWVFSFVKNHYSDEKAILHKAYPIVFTLFWFVCLTCAILTPSRNTILMIATSEFSANYLSSTGTGTEVTGLVQDTLKLLHNQVSAQLEHKDNK